MTPELIFQYILAVGAAFILLGVAVLVVAKIVAVIFDF